MREAFETRHARRAVRTDDPPTAIGGIASKRKVDLASFRFHAAMNDGEIVLLRVRPVFLQRRVERPTLRDHDNA